jgi:hypothetical protein
VDFCYERACMGRQPPHAVLDLQRRVGTSALGRAFRRSAGSGLAPSSTVGTAEPRGDHGPVQISKYLFPFYDHINVKRARTGDEYSSDRRKEDLRHGKAGQSFRALSPGAGEGCRHDVALRDRSTNSRTRFFGDPNQLATAVETSAHATRVTAPPVGEHCQHLAIDVMMAHD